MIKKRSILKSSILIVLGLTIASLHPSVSFPENFPENRLSSQRASPDLVIIEGTSWQKFLSTIPAISRINSLPPILFFKEENKRDIQNFINFLNPQKILILGEGEILPSFLKKLCSTRETVHLSGDYLKTSTSLAERRWKESYRAILVSDDDYEACLLSSPLAARYQCPLLFFSNESIPELTLKTLIRLNSQEIMVIGKVNKQIKKQLKVLAAKIVFIPEKSSLVHLYLKTILPISSGNNLIVTNPEDLKESSLSLLSSPLSVIRRAPILFCSAQPEEIEKKIKNFEKGYNLSLSYLTLIGDEVSLPPKRVSDPVYSQCEPVGNEVIRHVGLMNQAPTKGNSDAIRAKEEVDNDFVNEEDWSSEINVEIGSYPDREEPLSLAVGRITAEDIYDGTLLLAKIISSQGAKLAGDVLMLSNADEGLDLCEIICRATVKEFENWRVPFKAYYRQEIDESLLKRELPGKDIIISEGHLWDLMVLFEEDMVKFSPSLVFAQSCDSLDSSYAYPLFRAGTVAYIGSTSAIHSASGAAFTKAFFDAILYEDMDVGSALLYAKNYLLTWVNLKKKRGHSEWAKAYRVALSFTLWGDPTTKLYLKGSPKPKLTEARIRRVSPHLLLTTPPVWYKRIETEKYWTKYPPGGKLAGVVKRKGGKEKRKVPALLFARIKLDNLFDLKLESSDLKEEEWVYTWDKKRKILYLLVYPQYLKKDTLFTFTTTTKK